MVTRPGRKATTPGNQTARKAPIRPAAVLDKVDAHTSYADTLRAVREVNIDFEALGTHVTSVRKTLKGDLLVELTKGAKATSATTVIRDGLRR